MGKKVIRILVTTMVEIKTQLPVDQAINDFELNSTCVFSNTGNIEVLTPEIREIKRVSYIEYNKPETEILLKPLKDG